MVTDFICLVPGEPFAMHQPIVHDGMKSSTQSCISPLVQKWTWHSDV